MAAYQVLIDQNLQDLNPILVGSASASTENWRTASMNHYTLIHFVRSGKGILQRDGQTYPVHAGQAFVIPSGIVAYYEPDPKDPWAYQWVGLTGNLSSRFDALPPVFDIPPLLQQVMCDPADVRLPHETLAYRIAAEMMFLYSLLPRLNAEKIDHIQKIKDHVQMFYADKLSIENIASSFGLTRSYLTDQFRKQTGYSIRQYILITRIQAAKQHLMHGASIKEAASLCGIGDVSNFTRLFTRETGKSPSAWVAWVQSNTEEFIKEQTDQK